MSEIIDISVGITEERIEISTTEVGIPEINATPTVIEVNIITGSPINPQSYDLSDFTNNSSNPFVQYSALAGFVPTSRLITINGVTQDLSSDRSWTVSSPVNWGSITGTLALQTDLQSALNAKQNNITLTTTGSSGASTLIGATLNIPTYTLAGLGGISLTSLSSTATGLTYTDTTGVFSLTSGYLIPTTASYNNANWDSAYTNRITSLTTTGSGAATLIGNVLNIPTPTAATFVSLTTTGSSGSSTLIGGVLNVPTYTLSGLGGVPDSRTLTINGTTYDLSADRSWTIATGLTVGTTPISSGTVGRILFEGAGNVLQESANLFWDNTNARLGIGTSTPGQALDVVTLTDATVQARLRNNNSIMSFEQVLDHNRIISINSAQNASKDFVIAGLSVARYATFKANGNVLIGTTTDAGFKLDVNGTVRITGAIYDSAASPGTSGQVLSSTVTGTAWVNSSTVTPAALTKTDDTNVTLTLGGSPSTSLLQGVSLTLGWTGTLADARIASASVWNAKEPAIAAGTTAQYWRGDKTWQPFPSLTGFVPYTGATTNVDLGTHTLSAKDLIINHSSGSGVAASITKGGSGEALTVVKTSGSGNAASITGGVTQLDELHLTTDLADSYISSAATWNAKQNAITLTTTGSSGPATLSGSTLNIPEYAGGGGGGTIYKLTAQTLTAASWSLSGSYYIYTFSNVNITVNTRVDFTPDNASYSEVTTCGMLPEVDVAAGSCTFYSLFPPQSNILGEVTIFPTV